ncbi:hypothetical protein [Embleya sp. NPDC050493]|uniref:hypothetical protein n=1 Tax=Embleya sp. NPDC050493 TaxID=3363989 RepID=UPI0037A702C5
MTETLPEPTTDSIDTSDPAGAGPAPEDAALVAALHRRIDDRIAGHRAADQKAGLLLAVIGFTTPVLSTLPTTTVARAAGAGLVPAVVLLVAVLLPRTHGWLRPARDPDAALRLLAERETPRELAAEYERLGRITAGKYALIRLALIVLALTASITAIAASTV